MLLDKLIDLTEGDEELFFALKNLLGIAASGLPNDGSLPTEMSELQAFQGVQRCLYDLRKPTRPKLRPDGILWRGRPDFLSDQMLAELIAEVEEWRPRAEIQKWGQYISPGGEHVAAFASSPALLEMMRELVGEVKERSFPSCLYYDEGGAHIKPHVDTDNFCVNVNLMLRHCFKDQRSSTLVIYPYNSEPLHVELEVGEMLILYADCVVHTRTPISEGEIIRNITFGYQPLNEIHQASE